MTDQELHDKLISDPVFASSFVVQNNFEAVQKKMQELGITAKDPNQAFNVLIGWSKSGKEGARKQIEYVCNVPYKNDAPNSTGGYANFFKANTTNEQRERMAGIWDSRAQVNGNTRSSAKVDWGSAALAFATTGIGGLIPYFIGQSQSDTNGKTPEQIAAEQKAAEEKKREEEQRKMLYWIGGGFLGLVAIGSLIAWAMKSSPKTSNNA